MTTDTPPNDRHKAALRTKRHPPGHGEGTHKLLEHHARTHQAHNRFEDAARCWKTLTALNPDTAMYWRELGRNLYQAKSFPAAHGALERAVALSHEGRDTHQMLAALQFAIGEEAKGRDTITRYFAHHPLSASPDGDRTTPGILRVNAVTGVRPLVGWKLPAPPLVVRRGGHFSLQHLLPDPPAPEHRLTLSSDQAPQIEVLPPIGLILNTIADPDIEGRALDGLAAFLRTRNEPVINRPEAVWQTTRERNYQRYADMGDIHFPRTLRFHIDGRDAESIERDLARQGLKMPFIIRKTGSHKGRDTALVTSLGDLDAFIAAQNGAGEMYAIAFVEARGQGGYFQKMRLLCIDGKMYPAVCHIDAHWNVHGFNRLDVMKNNPWMMQTEEAFMNDPESVLGADVMGKLKAMTEDVGLDYFGFDFAVQDDGRPLIYELNPAMRHKFDYAEHFPYMRPGLENITQAFTAMVKDRLRAPTP